jgi:hypothetical protein
MSANRVEKLVYWYLRFNGYLTVENFTVHPDHPIHETEADFLAVRFPWSKEEPDHYRFERDPLLVLPDKIDFIIGESKTGKVELNENSWGNPDRHHVQYALEWMGIFTDDQAIENAAQALYKDKIWEKDNYCVRFVCFGRYSNKKLSDAFPRLLQINHQHMMEFVYHRLTTYCNCLHRGNWEPYIKDIVTLIEIGANPEMLLSWTLAKEK